MPQPGWYDDPGGSTQERYWEGTRWTKNLRDRPAPLPGTGKQSAAHEHQPAPRQSAPQHQPSPRPGPGMTPRQLPPQGGGAPQQYGPPGPGPRPGPVVGHPGQAPVAYKMVRTTEDGVPLAGFWQRALATLIDAVLMSIIGGLLAWPYLVRAWNAYNQVIDWMLANPGRTVAFSDYDYTTPATLVQFAILGVSFLTQVVLVRFFGGTLGQLLLGLRVVPAEKGLTRRVGWNTSLLRSGVWLAIMAATQVVLFPLMISYLRPLWHPRLKTWHDSVANTQVITTRGAFARSVLARGGQPRR